MGVPKFANWISRKYSNIAQRLPTRALPSYFQRNPVASLSLDLNGIIHQEAGKVHLYGQGETNQPKVIETYQATSDSDLEKQHFSQIAEAIYDLVKLTKPNSTLIIAIDGPAPVPKIYQQKQRRFKARSQVVEEKGQYMTHSTITDSNPRFDSNQITPGTPFMARLDTYLKAWVKLNRQSLPTRVIYSSHQVPGEGEHKIAEYLRKLQFPLPGSHIVYGLDADLILLGLLCPKENYKLLRDDISQTGEIYHIFDINVARQRIKADMGSIDDFVILSFLAGNDFLPAFPSIGIGNQGIDKLMEIYRKVGVKLSLENGYRLDWEAMLKFMQEFENQELSLLQDQANLGSAYPSIPLNASISKGIVDLEKFRVAFYGRALAPHEDQANTVLPLDSEVSRLNMGTEWLGAVAWIYKYYNQGLKGVNVEWIYPYNYVPLAKEIVISLGEVDLKEGRPLFEWQAIDRKGRIFTPLEQLVAVLPPASAKLIPEELRSLITSRDSVLGDLTPTRFLADVNGKQKDHEAVALLPFINPDRVRKAVSEVELSEVDILLNRQQVDWFSKKYSLPVQQQQRR